MSRAIVNLASRPLGNQLLPRIVLLVFGVATIVCTGWNVTSYLMNARAAHAFSKKVKQTEADIAALREERMEIVDEIQGKNMAALGVKVEVANELLRKREFSWTRLFNQLEQVQPYRVQLERVQPAVRAEGVTVTIGGEAETYDGVLEYIDRLEASPSFSHVFPRSEVLTERKGFRFLLSMVYHPGAEPSPDTTTEERG